MESIEAYRGQQLDKLRENYAEQNGIYTELQGEQKEDKSGLKKCEKDLQRHNIEFSLLSSLGIFKFLE